MVWRAHLGQVGQGSVVSVGNESAELQGATDSLWYSGNHWEQDWRIAIAPAPPLTLR